RTYDVTTRALVIAAAGAPAEGADLIDGDGDLPDAVHPLFVDVTQAECPTAAVAVAVIRGARLVRTADVRGARRVCDVLAAVLEAR
ncbi:MAG: hypothetical protein M3291_15050, partial [Actinomycetota bacterium]|nr:hypothetical protein [Actinomycetota bacterium]